MKVGVIGLGYVGLPLIKAALESGLPCVGLDVSKPVVDALNSGLSHIDDISNADVADMLRLGFVASIDDSVLSSCDMMVICVPTPLAPEGGPDLGAVLRAAESVSANLSECDCVILESTTWPGTTDQVLRTILERSGLRAGMDFHLAFSPERIDPGNTRFGIRNTPKVVGGVNHESTMAAATFYENFVDTVVFARGTREAEMAKLLENTYRQVNIALVNEMAKFSHELGIDIWNVIECASTKPFGFERFRPGHGVGGHCIPIDPSYLSHHVQARLGYPFRFVELAQEVNRSMPLYVARRAQDLLNDLGKAVRGARILLLGVTYKPGIADQRESPAKPLAEALGRLGASIEFYDHFVEDWHLESSVLRRVSNVSEAMREADLVIYLQPHADYSPDLLIVSAVPVLDTRGELEGRQVRRL